MRKMNEREEKDSLMIELAKFIEEHCLETLSLTHLAKEALLSTAHFQKRFKSEIGVSPKEYQEACRLKHFKSNLRTHKSVTTSIYESGHSSPSRVYEKLSEKVGMTPREYQKGGAGLEISYGWADTILGCMLMAATDRGLCFIQFGKTKKQLLTELKKEFPHSQILPMSEKELIQYDSWLQALNDFLSGKQHHLDLPLNIMGTTFQLKVWKFLQSIPVGKTLSYSEVAQKIKQPKAVRAVASACARNNIAILIPCHRVLRGSGDLAGYRWGLNRKQTLLAIEKDYSDN